MRIQEGYGLETGIKGKQTKVVTAECTAKAMGSGSMDVFATPAMIALMEETAWKSVAAALDPGYGTVGIRLEVTHDAPTPLGTVVTCESELLQVDGRKLTFEVRAYDEAGCIGKAVHERFIVEEETFMKKALCRGHQK